MVRVVSSTLQFGSWIKPEVIQFTLQLLRDVRYFTDND
jgi:hypothetical protein